MRGVTASHVPLFLYLYTIFLLLFRLVSSRPSARQGRSGGDGRRQAAVQGRSGPDALSTATSLTGAWCGGGGGAICRDTHGGCQT